MAKRNLFHPEISQSETDDLYNGTLIPRPTRPVKLTAADVENDGVVKRGTPLTSTDGVNFKVSATNIRAILLHDIDVNETTEAANAVVGIGGEFNQNKLNEALQDALDDDTASLSPLAVMDAWGRQIHIEASKKYPPVETYPLG